MHPMRVVLLLFLFVSCVFAEPRLPDIAKNLGEVVITAPASIAPDNSPVIGGTPRTAVRKYLTLAIDAKRHVRVLWSLTRLSGSTEREVFPPPVPLITGKSYQFTVARFVDSRGFYHYYLKTIADGATILLNTAPVEMDRLDA